jgi:hypothetical protein
VGSEISIGCGNQRTNAKISEVHNPEYIPSPDRIKRIEVYEKEWARLDMGALDIDEGKQQIVLSVKSILGSSVGEIKGLQLTQAKQ